MLGTLAMRHVHAGDWPWGRLGRRRPPLLAWWKPDVPREVLWQCVEQIVPHHFLAR